MMKHNLSPVLERIAEALERLAPQSLAPPSLDGADAFVWHPPSGQLNPVTNVHRVAFDLLKGIDQQAA
ncbi:MAG: AAA family ATPase, partial [Magnetovibrio sp.]|nr:AAA family ATPase [Magnetovibrio sp.]